MRFDEHSQRLSGRSLNWVGRPRLGRGTAAAVMVTLLGLCGCERREIDAPRIGESASPGAEVSSPSPVEEANEPSGRGAANEAVRVEVLGIEEAAMLPEIQTPQGRRFVIAKSSWQNILPRQSIAKSKLEGKADRTMGVGGLTRGGGQADEEMVEVDVAYRVPKWGDHVYLLADGAAFPLHPQSAEIQEGVDPAAALEIAEHGEVVTANLLFLAPEGAKDLALRLFDYTYGHVTVPIQGRVRRAVGDGRPPRGALGEAVAGELQLATFGVDLRPEHHGQPAPAGRRWAIVDVAGKSLSRSGGVGNIVEIRPREYLWLVTDGGYLQFAESRQAISFTPEIFQHQEVVFSVPSAAERLELGARIGNEVLRLPLSRRAPREIPDATGSHRDGEVMQVELLGTRREGELVVLDLCIRPQAETRGLEIQAAAQFLLEAGSSELRLDPRATAALPHPPPEPFVVPPGTPLRFELAYRTRNTPDALRVRGFKSEGRIEL